MLYENSNHGIKIEYPSNWTKKNLGVDNVVAFRPPADSSGKYAVGLGIYVHKLPVANLTLEDYSSMQVGYLKNKSLTSIKSDNTTLANYPGTNVTYGNNKGLQALEVWTIKDGKAYVIIYLAEKGKYNQYLSPIETMIDSFEIQSNSTDNQDIINYPVGICKGNNLSPEDAKKFCK